MDIYKGIIDRYIPSKIITIKPRNKPWFNKRVKTSIRTKHRLFNKYKKHPCAENWSKYKRARNSSVSIIREAKTEYHEKIQNELLVSNLTSKKFWSLTNGLLGAKSNMSIPAVHHNGVSVSDNAQKAELFNIDYSCGLSTATMEYSSPSVPPYFCVCVCVCVCLSVCLTVYRITQKIMVQST